MNKKYFLTFILVFVLCAALFVGCGSQQANFSAQVANAQQNVPFKIMIPTYLPPDMKSHSLSISPPDKGRFSEDSTLIGIRFFQQGSPVSIIIYEENAFATAAYGGIPLEDPYLYINGIQVLEQKGTSFVPDYGRTVESTNYDWNQDDITITMRITGIDNEECRKIVESMIMQNK
jgi:hypothetical protein